MNMGQDLISQLGRALPNGSENYNLSQIKSQSPSSAAFTQNLSDLFSEKTTKVDINPRHYHKNAYEDPLISTRGEIQANDNQDDKISSRSDAHETTPKRVDHKDDNREMSSTSSTEDVNNKAGSKTSANEDISAKNGQSDQNQNVDQETSSQSETKAGNEVQDEDASGNNTDISQSSMQQNEEDIQISKTSKDDTSSLDALESASDESIEQTAIEGENISEEGTENIPANITAIQNSAQSSALNKEVGSALQNTANNPALQVMNEQGKQNIASGDPLLADDILPSSDETIDELNIKPSKDIQVSKSIAQSELGQLAQKFKDLAQMGLKNLSEGDPNKQQQMLHAINQNAQHNQSQNMAINLSLTENAFANMSRLAFFGGAQLQTGSNTASETTTLTNPKLSALDSTAQAGHGLGRSATGVQTYQGVRAPIHTLPMRALERMSVDITQKAKAGNTRFEIRLDPAELGRVEVKLDFKSDSQNVRAHLIVEKAETYDLLQRDQRLLGKMLEDTGLQLEDGAMEFSLKQEQNQEDNENGNANASLSDENQESEVSQIDAAILANVRISHHASGLDLRI